MDEQNYGNHVKLVPLFHFFVLPVLLINVIGSIRHLVVTWFSWNALIGLLTAMALLMLALLARMFALKVQDRVIRLEERLRCERLLPADLKARIGEITPEQFVALRFASDGEFPGLVSKVLSDKINHRKAIKQMVKSWRADYLRA
jgi:Family of unknown function (DUF6526)